MKCDINLGDIIIEHATDAVFLAPLTEDGVYGNFVAVNQTACDRLGYTREELLQMNARNLNPTWSECVPSVVTSSARALC
jgi:PAS domain S-box-containing protein